MRYLAKSGYVAFLTGIVFVTVLWIFRVTSMTIHNENRNEIVANNTFPAECGAWSLPDGCNRIVSNTGDPENCVNAEGVIASGLSTGWDIAFKPFNTYIYMCI